MRLARVIRISRPRFWIYELGPYLIGVVAGILAIGMKTDALSWATLSIFTFYFLIPANIWIYGINDIYDYETDKLNPKKQGYEALVEPKEHKKLRWWIGATTLPFLAFLPLRIPVVVAFLLFLFFSAQYSAKPIRAKGIPVIDTMFSAGHYIATAVFSFLLIAPESLLNRHYIVAGIMWAMAMHAFSAVPDIEADRDGGIDTVATLLGKGKTITLCFCLYLAAGILSFSFGGWIIALLSLLYAVMMIYAYFTHTNEKLFIIYKRFPRINTITGMILFFLVLSRII